jgi:hypothetical protein
MRDTFFWCVYRVQLDAPIGSLIAVSRLGRSEEEEEEACSRDDSGSVTQRSVGSDEDVVPPAKIVIHPVLLSADKKPSVSAGAMREGGGGGEGGARAGAGVGGDGKGPGQRGGEGRGGGGG